MCIRDRDNSIGDFSKLYKPNIDKRCCLGILLEPFFQNEYLINIQTPSKALYAYKSEGITLVTKLLQDLPKEIKALCNITYDKDKDIFFDDSEETSKLMEINDTIWNTSEELEQKLKEAFLEIDIEVEFVGEYDLVYEE